MPNQRIFKEFFLGHKVKQGLEGEADDGNISPVLVFWQDNSRPVIRKGPHAVRFNPIKQRKNQTGNSSGDRIDETVSFHRRMDLI
jgi:hypothetical protein